MKLNYTKLNVKTDVDEIIVLCTKTKRPVKGNVNKQPNSLGSLISAYWKAWTTLHGGILNEYLLGIGEKLASRPSEYINASRLS